MTCWLDLLTQSTRFSEAPERYFWWSGLAMLSATVKKNIYLDRFYYKLYPNIYVVLVSKKSGLRKGVPVSLASKILAEVGNTRLIEGRNSIQGIIRELATQRTNENGTVFSNAQGILLSGEWDTFLTEDTKGLTILTALYNTHEHHNGWKNTLKESPVDNLKEPCLTLLAASNETLFEDMVKAKDVEGGFIARTFIVHESKRRLINSLTTKPEGIIESKILAQHLKDVSKLKGEFQWTVESAALYDRWYRKISTSEYEDRTGTLERMGDSVLKAAMLISLARRLELELKKSDLEEAIERCEGCFMGTKQVTMGNGQSEISGAVSKVLKVLIASPNHQMPRLKILQKLWPDIDAMVMDRVIETLSQSGSIDMLRGERKTGVVYKLTDKVVRLYTEFEKENEEE